jgi:hypothetical protein
VWKKEDRRLTPGKSAFSAKVLRVMRPTTGDWPLSVLTPRIDLNSAADEVTPGYDDLLLLIALDPSTVRAPLLRARGKQTRKS